jgi:peptide/nickel transport system permease protein
MSGRLLRGAARFLLFLWAVASLTFVLARLVPGDPVLAALGSHPRAEDIRRLRRQLGLERPLTVQYGRFLAGLAVLDLGESLVDRRPVAALLRSRLQQTLLLAAAAMALTLPFSLLLGGLSAWGRSRLWRMLEAALTAVGLAVPVFLLGLALILALSLGLGLLPVSGSGGIEFLVLPAVTLSVPLSAMLTRMVRVTLCLEARRPYVLLARAKGLTPGQVLRRHVLKNALPPIVTVAGLQLGALLSGAIVVENVFSWPGIGTLLVTAVRQRDFPVIQGAVLLMAAAYYLTNRLVDQGCARLDPRSGRERSR